MIAMYALESPPDVAHCRIGKGLVTLSFSRATPGRSAYSDPAAALEHVDSGCDPGELLCWFRIVAGGDVGARLTGGQFSAVVHDVLRAFHVSPARFARQRWRAASTPQSVRR